VTYGHRFEHLSSADDGLSGEVALGDHHLLGHEDLRGRDFDTEISTSDHDTIGFTKDLVEVGNTLKVLNLDDDFDVLSSFSQVSTNVLDVLSTTDERGEDHVDTVLDTESEIVLVLLRDGREIDVGSGKVDSLLRREGTVVDGFDFKVVGVDLENVEGEDTVVDVDGLSLLDNLGEVGVVDVHDLLVTLGSVLGVGGEDHLVSSVDLDLLEYRMVRYRFENEEKRKENERRCR